MRIYLRDRDALAWFDEAATPSYWDRHWQMADLRQYITEYPNNGLFVRAVRRYLMPGSMILEGGCGRGQIVHALSRQGFHAVGVDYATETVGNIKAAVPTLPVLPGDVRDLAIASNVLDGYISVGVIEHFWSGYDAILAEMQRTLRVGGYLFISFPYLSPLRRWKVKTGVYPHATSAELNHKCETFYQFSLSVHRVEQDLRHHGFETRARIRHSGVKGLKSEVDRPTPWLQQVFEGEKGVTTRRILEVLTRSWAAHSMCLIMEKIEQP